MKAVLIAAACVLSAALTQAAQAASPQTRGPASGTPQSSDRIAEAYNQFLLARYYEDDGDFDKAIAAYKRSIELDPGAADVPAELAALYLRDNNVQDALETAERALKIEPDNREANRVLGLIYAALADSDDASPRGRDSSPRRGDAKPDENTTKAIHHLEVAVTRSPGEAEPNLRATLGRMYLSSGAYDNAITLLVPLVNQEPQWQEGPSLLAQAYAGAGRIQDGIGWLQDQVADDPRLLPTLADFYERGHQWNDAAETYARAIQLAPFGRDTVDLRKRYASALLNVGGRDAAIKARDALLGSGGRGAASTPLNTSLPTDARALYLLSQAQRRLGDTASAETAARALIAKDSKVPWGYYALAEALEERGEYQRVVEALASVVAQFRPKTAGDDPMAVNMLLPHLGFAYQQLAAYDKAIATFEEARRLAPNDPSLAGYLVEANMAAKKYGPAIDIARAASVAHPDDLRLIRVQAQALHRSGKTDQALTLMRTAVGAHEDDPMAHVALASLYAEAARTDDAIKVLREAQAKFPDDNSVSFELGAVFDKQRRFADAESVFKEILTRDPDNAAALNYLGYMLAERGERLDESVGLLTHALQLEPDNGSFLDSLGWAYYKADKLDLAEHNLRRAADQLRTNSVIQDHYGDLLFKLRRFDDAIAAWTRALSGDGDSIDRGDIDKKIRTAKQHIGK